MHRLARYRPPSNHREHVQRNLYARSSLQRRRLFQHTSNYKNKVFYIFAGTLACAIFLHWGSVLKRLVDGHHNIKNADSTISSRNGPTTDLLPKNPSRYISHSPAKKEGMKSSTFDSPQNSHGTVSRISVDDEKEEMLPLDPDDVKNAASSTTSHHASSSFDDFKCSFRKYKRHRYYTVDDISEDFLSDAEYIRGQLPFVINAPTHDDSKPKKLCTDTSDWENVLPDHRPFSDGQNPSFVSLKKYPYGTHRDYPRMDETAIKPLVQIYGEELIEQLYLGLLLFGDSQCRWNMTTEELESSKFSPLQSPPSKRSLVMILDHNLDPIGKAVLELELDAPWGSRKKYSAAKKKDGSGHKTSIVELDDARLFFHGGRLNVLYRNGPAFGYDKQLQNPIHFERVSNTEFRAFIKASETFSVCCGRNIAFISEVPSGASNHDAVQNPLQALMWIDPVTVEQVPYPDKIVQIPMASNIPPQQQSNQDRRRLASKKRSSIHGTNGYLVPLDGTNELLGIAHFHRPEHRQQSDYARHGHHYTHAFFTLEPKGASTMGDDTSKSYKLKRLSNEFVFLAPSADNEKTAEVIQFASGLDLVGSDRNGKLMVSYGINDCEAAIVFLGMEKIQKLLLPVEDGQEVLNLMQKLETI